MKKTIYLAFACLAILAMASCGNKSEKSQTGPETEEAVQTPTSPDYAGLTELANKSGELTSSDYDFLLDQTEIFTNMAIKMGKEEYEKYISSLTEEQLGAVFVLGAVNAAAKKGELSDSQLKRFNELKEKDPTK